MSADLAQHYGIVLEDVWSGKVSTGRVLILVEHLLLNPASRCRAIRYGGDLRWIGWDYNSEVLASLFDLVTAFAAGKNFSNDMRFERPGHSVAGRGSSEPEELVAPTIADFNAAAFMRQVYS